MVRKTAACRCLNYGPTRLSFRKGSSSRPHTAKIGSRRCQILYCLSYYLAQYCRRSRSQASSIYLTYAYICTGQTHSMQVDELFECHLRDLPGSPSMISQIHDSQTHAPTPMLQGNGHFGNVRTDCDEITRGAMSSSVTSSSTCSLDLDITAFAAHR